jgi:hypothetical protein
MNKLELNVPKVWAGLAQLLLELFFSPYTIEATKSERQQAAVSSDT